MSMITLNGFLVNIYKQPKKGDRDEKDKIQILGDIPIEGGGVRKDLVTITVPDASAYEGCEGTEVSVAVGAFAPQKGSVIFFVNKT